MVIILSQIGLLVLDALYPPDGQVLPELDQKEIETRLNEVQIERRQS